MGVWDETADSQLQLNKLPPSLNFQFFLLKRSKVRNSGQCLSPVSGTGLGRIIQAAKQSHAMSCHAPQFLDGIPYKDPLDRLWGGVADPIVTINRSEKGNC